MIGSFGLCTVQIENNNVAINIEIDDFKTVSFQDLVFMNEIKCIPFVQMYIPKLFCYFLNEPIRCKLSSHITGILCIMYLNNFVVLFN